jgi:uncharacterized protein YuzE
MPIRLTLDATTDVAYLELRPTGPADVLGPALLLETDRAFAGHVIADFTLADGRLVGLELQHASACLPADLLVAAERIDGQNLERRLDQRLGRLLASAQSPSSRSRDALN